MPPAGWYPDPEGGAKERFWDGERWTDRYQEPAGHRAADPSDPPRRLRTLQTLAIVGLCLIGLIELFNLSADGQYLGILNDTIDGNRPADSEINDAVDTVDRASGAVVFAYLVLGPLTFLPWFYRGYANLRRLGVQRLRYSPGWSIGAWFIPIFNLFRPKQIANDLYRASAPDATVTTASWHERKVTPLLHWWWSTFLIAAFLGNAAAGIVTNANDDPLLTQGQVQDALEQERSGFAVDAFSSVVSLVAIVLAIIVIRRITRAQEAVMDGLVAGESQ